MNVKRNAGNDNVFTGISRRVAVLVLATTTTVRGGADCVQL